MARRILAAALSLAAIAGLVQAANAAPVHHDRAVSCQCRDRAVRRTVYRRNTYRAEDRSLAWAQTREVYSSAPVYAVAAQPPVVEGPVYNFYGPVTNYYGPPPVMPPPDYSYGYGYGYGGLPPADEGARLDPWNGYDPYNGLENGY